MKGWKNKLEIKFFNVYKNEYRVARLVNFTRNAILKELFNFEKKLRDMNILAEKIEIVKMILETDNPNILQSVKNIFKKNATTDFWETLPQEQKEDILQGMKDIEDGDIIDYEVFMKKYR